MTTRRAHAEDLDDASDSSEDEVNPTHDLKILQVIGEGAYGTVYRAIYRGQLIAVKIIEHDEGARKDGNNIIQSGESFCPYDRDDGAPEDTIAEHGQDVQINNSITEGVLSAIMNHPNIVRSLGYEAVLKRGAAEGGTHEIRLLMEFCDRGSLDKAVAAGCFHEDYDGILQVNMHHLLKTLIETAHAMKHLHNMHILHRDLKIQNILLKSSNRDARGFTVKVSDFGLAKVWDGRGGTSPTENQKYAGTVTHMPPELIERGEVSTKCDVYAFGIFMWECYTRLAPYKGLKPPQIVLGVVSEKLRPAFSETTPKGYRDLARWCWSHDPRERPTFSQIAKFLLMLLEEEEHRHYQQGEDSLPY